MSKGRNLSTQIYLWVLGEQWKPKASACRLHFAIANMNFSVQALKLYSWEACLNFYLNVCTGLSHHLFRKQKIFETMHSSIQWQYEDNSSCLKGFFNFCCQNFVNYTNDFKFSCLKKTGRKIIFLKFLVSL